MSMNRRQLIQLLISSGLIGSTQISFAQESKFPSKAVRIIIPFAAGQGSDVLARSIADRLGVLWGQAIVVDNRSGANGSIAIQELLRAPPDGHTLLLTSNSPLVINPSIYRSLPYNVDRDLTPIALLANAELALVINPQLPVQSTKELIAYLKANPGKLSYGSPGHGSTSHLTMEAFKQVVGVDITHIAYKGSAPAMTDLMGGVIQLMIDALPSTLPVYRTNKVKVLATTGLKPSSFVPEIPTLSSQGITGLPTGGWYGFVAPARMDPGLVARINKDVLQVMDTPSVKDRLKNLSMEAVQGEESAGFIKLINKDREFWEKLTRKLNLYQTE